MNNAQKWKLNRREITIIAVLTVLTALEPLSIDAYLSSFIDISETLNAPVYKVQASLSVFLGGFAVGQLFWGPLSDRIGRRLPILASLALFSAGFVCLRGGGRHRNVLDCEIFPGVFRLRSRRDFARRHHRRLPVGENTARILHTVDDAERGAARRPRRRKYDKGAPFVEIHILGHRNRGNPVGGLHVPVFERDGFRQYRKGRIFRRLRRGAAQ